MRNYIILNGTNSNTITGLLIQSLAPISKPLMRTEIEEIDGRDGDIVTPLGFSAYDKEITIGLYGNFDIDQVSAFFNSEGTVIFSNEPEKYYNYQIYDQIDYERLVRYRTATVRLHCQPFKYSATQTAAILSSSSNYATLDQSLNTDSSNYTYSSNVQADVTATRTTTTSGGKFFAVFTANVVQGVTYHFSGVAPRNVSIYGYQTALRGTSAGFAGKAFQGDFTYTATFTGTLVVGFYASVTSEVYIRNFTISNEAGATVSGEGSNIVLDGTAENLFNKLDTKGNAFQQTYSGKNKMPQATYDADENRSRTFRMDLSAGTYVISFDLDSFTLGTNTTFGINMQLRFADSTTYDPTIITVNSSTTTGRKSFTFTITKDVSSDSSLSPSNIRIAQTTYDNGARATLSNIQIEEGSTASDYENYTGGIPSPNTSYPQDVQVVTGEQTIKITGKNLAKMQDGDATASGITASRSSTTGEVILNNTSTSTATINASTLYTIPIVAGEAYTISANNAEANSSVSIRLNIQNVGSYQNFYLNDANQTKTFTSDYTGNCTLQVRVSSGKTLNNYIVKPQVERSASASQFEPYQEQSYPLSLGTKELAKISNYQDYFYKSGNKWYLHEEIAKYIFDGSDDETWYVQQSGTDNYFYRIDGDNYATGTGRLSNYFTAVTITTANTLTGFYVVNTNQMRFRPNFTELSIADWKTWLSTHNVTVYYPLATSTDTEITDATLISQLEALQAAHAYRGRTHIDAIATGTNMPHIIEAEVNGDASGTVTNAGNIYSKPKLTIFGSGNIGIYLNGVQMFQVALESDGYITIDTALMEAYKDNLQTLKNRQVTGDYSNFSLPVGESTISFSGSVTMCVVENYSRWL